MSSTVATSASPDALDERRLRAGLRLFLHSDRADAAAADILRATDRLGALRTLGANLVQERRIRGLVARVPFLNHQLSGLPPTYAIPDAVSPRAIVALVAHLALRFDGEQLEDTFGLDGREIGEDLLAARTVLHGKGIGACKSGGWIIGRYRDRALPADDRVLLLSHVTTCDVCRDALDTARQADATFAVALAAELDRLPEAPLSTSSIVRRRRLGAMPLVAGVVVGFLVVMMLLSVVSGLFTGSHEPVPLLTSTVAQQPPLDGWVMQVSPVGYLEAVNLATGQKRGLDSGDPTGIFPPFYRVSATHIAAWRPSDGQRDDVLTIGPIAGPVRHRLTWSRRFVYWYPSGWLDDTTLLLVKSPDRALNEDEDTYIRRLSTESQLIAFDAISGSQRVLMTGNLAAAYPSPDGTMLAIVPPIDRHWPGDTLEIRPFDGSTVGEPIVRIDHRVVSDGYWLPDSSAYVASVISDSTIIRQEWTNQVDLLEWGIGQVALERIGRDGHRSSVVTTDVPDVVIPLAISPDGQDVVYQQRQYKPRSRLSGVPEFAWQCFRQPIAGGEPVLLVAGEVPERVFQPVWSPNGATLVMPIARAFPLSTDGRLEQPLSPNATTLLLFGETWQPGDVPRVLYSAGRDLHGWVPAEQISPRERVTKSGERSLASIAYLEDSLERVTLGDHSVVSARGDYIVLTERASRSQVIWNVEESRQRRLVDGTTDLSWFNDGHSTIGVVRDRYGDNGSRIIINAADISRSAAFLDHRLFDPAGLGDDPDKRYGRPLVSPTGNTISFFVVDQVTGRVSLWLDTGAGDAETVADWQLPEERVVVPPLIASWVQADTFLFVQPTSWADGVPQQATLFRLTLSRSGDVEVERLVSFDAQRGAAGVVLTEMALSPSGQEFAYRLHHLDDASAGSGGTDTLHVAGTDDLSRAIELARGGQGTGLAWTIDGAWVVATVRDRIARFSPDGRDLEYLSPRYVRATHPRVVGDAVWFEAVSDGGAQLWQVAVE